MKTPHADFEDILETVGARMDRVNLDRLITLFPVFDVAWADEVKAKWFEVFAELRLLALEADAATIEEIAYPEWH